MNIIVIGIGIGGFILFIVFIAALWTYHDSTKKPLDSKPEDSSRDKSAR